MSSDQSAQGQHQNPRPKTKATVYLETYGCQMNALDSELVATQLKGLGYGLVTQAEQADVVLLNTCSVRELSEQKVWSQLGRLGIANQSKERIIGVLGCMAEREGEAIYKRMPHVDVLCGPSELDRLPAMVDNAVMNRELGRKQTALSGHTNRRSKTLDAARDSLEHLDLSRSFSPERGAGSQAYVRITRGCNKFCSFCVVPFTRGPEVHRPAEHIVDEVRTLCANGVLEVTLLGQTVNHYHYREGGKSISFAELLKMVHDQVPELPRLRFITSYPRDFTDEALDVMAASPRICRYLHIPAQSGSDRLLKKMNRGYTVEAYLSLLERARARMPDIRLAGDMIVGYPTETEEDHQASIALLRTAMYKSCFIFKYSPRSGTVAFGRHADDVPESVKKARNQELLAVQSEISQQLMNEWIGRELEVLVESEAPNKGHRESQTIPEGWGVLRGRTRGDEIVVFTGPKELIGTLSRVKAEAATPLTIHGRWRGDGAVHAKPRPDSKLRLPVINV